VADHSTLKGTLGGMLTVTLATIHTGEIVKTIILATIGAVVSYSVSLMLNKITKRIRRRKARDATGR
jgi:hypothetical protein